MAANASFGAANGSAADAAGDDDNYKVVTSLLLSFIIVVTVAGNTLIIIAVLTTRRLRTVTNCFVMSLAVADWLVGIFVMPIEVAYIFQEDWTWGNALCRLWISLDVLLCTASILSLCAISIDRYLAVTQPLNYSRRRRSKRLAMLMIFFVWLLAMAITSPPLFISGTAVTKSTIDGTVRYDCKYNDGEIYVIFSAMGSFFLPLIVMLYVYAKISCVIARRHSQLTGMDRVHQRTNRLVSNLEESDMDRGSSECEDGHFGVRCTSVASPVAAEYNNSQHRDQQRDQQRSMRGHNCSCNDLNHHVQNHSTAHHSNRSSASFYGRSTSRPESLALDVTSVDAGIAVTLTHHEASSRVSSFRRESKTAQTLSIVVGGFVACWLPFFIAYIITPYVEIYEQVMKWLVYLGWMNSAINPFIYAFYSPDFRIAFWRLTLRHCSKPRRPQDPSLRRR